MVKRNLSRKLELFCLSVDQGEGLWTKFFINRYRRDFYFFYANWQREENKTTLKKIVLGIQNYFLDKLEKNLPKKSSSNNWYLASARQSKLHISICAKESSNFYTLDTKS